MIDITRALDQWGPIDGRLLYPSFWHVATTRLASKLSGTPWPVYIGIHGKNKMEYYWIREEMQTRGEAALKRWILPKSARKSLYKKYSREVKLLARLAQKTNFADSRNADKLYHGLIMLWAYALVPELANFAVPGYVERQLQGLVPKQNLNEVLEVLLAPKKLSFLQQGELELLKIVAITKNKKQLLKKLEKYSRKWYWLENSYYEDKVLTARYFYSQVKGRSRGYVLNKLKSLQRYSLKVRQRRSAIINKHHLPKKILDIARACAFSIWWQDHRKRTTWWAHSLIDKFNEQGRIKFKLKIDDLMYYRADEWRDLFLKSKKVRAKLIAQRKSFMLLKVEPNSYMEFYDAGAKKFINKLRQREKMRLSDEISGTSVSRSGKRLTRGRVRLLFSARLASKMKDGEILVAPMTSPDYIVAMRKAKAIITDVGGLMSHSAVVSRELGIPCIVGTKFATKIFKDGDIVEVDANKGIVRKVK